MPSLERERKIISLVTSFPPTLCILSLEMANYFSLMVNSPKKSSSASTKPCLDKNTMTSLFEQTCLAPIPGTS